LREGVRTVLYGAPNVGKSSLLNRLLGFERAIVSATPGTTRDTIEEVINLRGIPLRLIDTAGMRAAHDAVEREGIARTLQHLERADLVLHIVDASQPCAEPLDPTRLLVLNKSDLGEHPSWKDVPGVRVSCLESAGPQSIEPLAEAIAGRILGGGIAGGDVSIAINARHQACLQSAARYVQAARAALKEGVSPEFIALELHSALDAVGDVVGRVDTEDLLGKIFSTFCVGK